MPPPPEGGHPKLGQKISIKKSAMKQQTFETLNPLYLSSINTDPSWNFSFKSKSDEFVRFSPESLSIVLFGTYPHTPVHGSANPEDQATTHSLRARSNQPEMFLLPNVMGSAFVKSVEVLINGIRVGTNDCLGNHLQHYAATSRIMCKNPKTAYLALNTDLASTNRDNKTAAMTEATKPFDYVSWSADTGTRIPVHLDGVFPFDTVNKTRMSAFDINSTATYFPPGTEFKFTFFLNDSKSQSVFHLGSISLDNYFISTATGVDRQYSLTFQSVELSYESVTLKPDQHLSVLPKLNRTVLSYPYDIAKVHYQPLTPSASYTENIFTIPARAEIIYILFLKNWQVHHLPSTKKPVTPFSRFPEGCTNMKLAFGDETHLIEKDMRDFGQRPLTSKDVSLYNFWTYMMRKKLFGGKYDTVFPTDADTYSLVQIIPADVSSLSSKTSSDLLKLQLFFSGAAKSPKDGIIFCISVHPTGIATCTGGRVWEFKEKV